MSTIAGLPRVRRLLSSLLPSIQVRGLKVRKERESEHLLGSIFLSLVEGGNEYASGRPGAQRLK